MKGSGWVYIGYIFIPQLISMCKQELFPFDRLIEFRDLVDINQAVADSEKGMALKAVVRMPQFVYVILD